MLDAGRPDLIGFGFSGDHAPGGAAAVLEDAAAAAAADAVLAVGHQFHDLLAAHGQKFSRRIVDARLPAKVAGVVVGHRLGDVSGLNQMTPLFAISRVISGMAATRKR